MEILESSSSFSLQSSDSLRDAFASLDAASANRSQHSIQSFPDSLTTPARNSLNTFNTFRAHKRQHSIDERPRALCGGDTLEQMRKEVRDRAIRQAELRRMQVTSEQSRRGLSVHSVAPSFAAFPMSIEDNQEDQGASSLENESVPQHTLSNYDPAQLIEAPAIDAPSSSTSNAVQEKKRRTFQWAAKRDKRIARRRQGPPLTRSQARERETSSEVLQHLSQTQALTSSANKSEDISAADITDPSYGTVVVVEMPQKEKGKAPERKKKKSAPLLDMTFTEHDVHVPVQSDSIESHETSQTQSEITSQELQLRRSVKVKRPDSSDTEEEEEMDQEVIQAWKKRKVATVEQDTIQKGKKTSRAARSKSRMAQSSAPKVKPSINNKSKGPLLFEGLHFIAFGFWAKVKMFEGLIEKHGGRVMKANGYSEEFKIDYMISCTHSGCKPASIEVERWKTQLAKDSGSTLAAARLFLDTKMIQEQWISDCIAKCLQKSDLLSIDKYTIRIDG